MTLGAFTPSSALTLGVELELQIVNLHDGDLTPHAPDLLRRFVAHNARVAAGEKTWDIKPEITRSMIEIGTSIQERHGPLLHELHDMRAQVVSAARFLNLGIGGGGTHPFQLWSDQQIFDGERFHLLHELYGYLAKQFTVFGQHVHLGCESGDDALWLLHALSRYVPHFIALSGSSPFVQGQDTGFDSARLNSVFAFPLSGRAPFVRTWDEFGDFFEKMASTGVVQSMKDFYWDIRPKPEYGTIELRVCDTPLSVEKAAALACYLQAICRHLLLDRPYEPSEDDYLVYTYNRFQACRFGLNADMVDPHSKQRVKLRDDVLRTLATIEPHARALDAEEACRLVRETVFEGNDAQWIRRLYLSGLSLPDIVARVGQRFSGLSQGSAGPPQGSLTPAGGGLGAARPWGRSQ